MLDKYENLIINKFLDIILLSTFQIILSTYLIKYILDSVNIFNILMISKYNILVYQELVNIE